ncbi:MAG: hypothetical protein ACTHL7_07380 [Steroidobacteraceae bacterium]
MRGNGEDIKPHPRPRHGPAWAYVFGGGLGLPIAVAFVAAALQLQPMDFEVPPPGALALFGVLLGGKAYLIFSKPLPPRPERR